MTQEVSIMTKERHIDPFFQQAEKLSANFSLFPEYEDNAVDHKVKGLISPERCDSEVARLRDLPIDSYIEQVVAPVKTAAVPMPKTSSKT